jgi:hypothetical protein
MANVKGNILNRTSYDVHQEVNAKVIGVLKANNKIREHLLRRNIGSYGMIDTIDGIGYISPLYSNEYRKPFSLGEDGLLGYTHLTNNEFQNQIQKKYDFKDIISSYRTDTLSKYNYLRWGGKFDDYTEYMSNTLGLSNTVINLLADLFEVDKMRKALDSDYDRNKSLTTRSILNDFLQYDNIKHALEKDRIGTVTPKPLLALAGAVTTNISNFSGTDTPLGLISNQIYALTLQKGAQFNTLRKIQHITPNVYDDLGNTLLNLPYLGSLAKIDPETGRLAYDYSNMSFVQNYESLTIDEFEDMDMLDATKDLPSSKNARYKNLIRNINKYLPFNGYRYETPQDFTSLAGSVVNVVKERSYDIWNEGDKGRWINDVTHIDNDTSYHGINEGKFTDKSLLSKTQTLFSLHNEKGIDTIIGRFHTSGGRDLTHNETNLLQTAVSKFGLSHGRNLLNKPVYTENANYAEKTTNGYSNPYCRAWTYHHQYAHVNDLIRPFIDEDYKGNTSIKPVDEIQRGWWRYGRTRNGATKLRDNSALNVNGFVNITPTSSESNAVDIKKCMFSIENLAWKDVLFNEGNALSSEQIGPNGGRIMWFPPYGLDFNETINVNWNPNEFIGRGEKVYTYTNTERAGTLSFILLVDHPSILDMWKKNGASANADDNEQQILRFFAGCDTLELNNIKIDNTPEEPIKPEKDNQPDQVPIKVTEETEQIIFYVFFPNNYTGINDEIDDVINYLSTSYEVSNNGSSNGTKLYKDYDWEYRVDKEYLNEYMKPESNFQDKSGYSLNTSKSSVISSPDFIDANYSFAEVSTGDSLKNKVSEIGDVIDSITIEGFASSQGSKNYILSVNRARVIKKWLQSTLSQYVQNKSSIFEIKPEGEIIEDDFDKNNVSGESAKRARNVKVVINVKKVKSIQHTKELTQDDTTNVSTQLNRSVDVNTATLTKAQKRAIRRKERKQEKEDKKEIAKLLKKTPYKTISEDRKASAQQSIEDIGSRAPEIQHDGISRLKFIKGEKLLSNETTESKRKEKGVRWENEAQYFQMLEANDSFLYSKVIDKIKYFTPAFHSITPEGFNARLGFLHQCTRQGATLGTSDERVKRTAGNMAFGRPPVCVLRIGDFYNTRIIINSVTITYENPQWDMNTEGIGMQPMMAKVSLNFVFLGGSDLGAPIARLQNAVSFNYYANQSIYDDRADNGIYNNKEARIGGTPWLPNYKRNE